MSCRGAFVNSLRDWPTKTRVTHPGCGFSCYSYSVNETLDQLEKSLDQAVERIESLALENSLLKRALADAESRMSAASVRLRTLAEKFPAVDKGTHLQ
jgi:FtsZ-binding cell division protein ZapB